MKTHLLIDDYTLRILSICVSEKQLTSELIIQRIHIWENVLSAVKISLRYDFKKYRDYSFILKVGFWKKMGKKKVQNVLKNEKM